MANRLLRAILVLLVIASPARAAWYRAETPAFIVYGQASASQVMAVTAQLAAFDQLLRQLTGTGAYAARARVSIYLVSDAGAFERLLGRGGPAFDGFYTATPNAIAAFVDTSDAAHATRAQTVLFHEYAHHFLFAQQHGSYPAWYIEGLASYWETARFSKNKARYGDYDAKRARVMMLAQWMPMARVLGADWSSLPGYETPLFYAQSWIAVHYFASDPARALALAHYLAAVAAGVPSGAAFGQAFGYPVERLDKILIDYVMGRALVPTEIAFVPTTLEVRVARLEPVADALLMPEAMLDIGAAPDAAAALLDSIRMIAARNPEDRTAQIVLATAEIRLGGSPSVRAQGRARVESLLLASPDNVPLLMLLGTAQLLAGQPALAALERAAALRGDDYRTLFLLALAQPPGAGSARRTLLLRANALAPQVEAVALAAAQAQAESGDYAAARAMLEPVANNPHGGRAADQARVWLAQLPPVAVAADVDGANVAATPK